jgi:hypothetical protein
MRAKYKGLNSLYVTLLIKYKLRNNALTTATVKCRKQGLCEAETLAASLLQRGGWIVLARFVN